MTCEEFEKIMTNGVPAHEETVATRASILGHMHGCEECRAIVKRTAALVSPKEREVAVREYAASIIDFSDQEVRETIEKEARRARLRQKGGQ